MTRASRYAKILGVTIRPYYFIRREKEGIMLPSDRPDELIEIEKARLINEKHRKLNSTLREENLLLSETLLDMYNLFSQIDFSAYDGELKMSWGDTLKYDLIPWEKWEIIIDSLQSDTLGTKPIQLKLL